MGDRTGLPRLDRTNGYEDGHGYMRAKKSKLAQQNEEIREALRHRHSAMRTELFKGISINVNGRTQPTADELKRIILLNGGEYHPYYRYQQTKFMIATNLSSARVKTLRPNDRIVKPEWITNSIKANCVLPYQDYQLFADEPRGKTGVLAFDSDTSNQGNNSNSAIINGHTAAAAATATTTTTTTKQTTIQQLLQASAAKTTITINTGANTCITTTSFTNPSSSLATASTSTTTSTTLAAASSQKASTKSSTSSSTSASSLHNNNNKKQLTQQATMNDFVVRGVSKPTRFPTPKVREQQRDVANIIGRTSIDDIVKLINEWVGCPEGIVDEDVACITKYFYDLMGERHYHNKFCEVIEAFRERVMEHGEKCWIDLYNDLAKTFKNELSSNAEASQSLCQLICYIDPQKDVTETTMNNDDDRPSTSGASTVEETTVNSDSKTNKSATNDNNNSKTTTRSAPVAKPLAKPPYVLGEIIDID